MGREVVARVLISCSAVLIVCGRGGRLRPLRAARRSGTSRTARPPRSPTPTCAPSSAARSRTASSCASAPDLVSAKPLIESTVAGIAGSPPFIALFEDSVRRVHSALLSGEDSRLRLDLRDIGVLVQSALGHLPIEGIDQIQADVALQLTLVSGVTETAAETAHRLRVLSLRAHRRGAGDGARRGHRAGRAVAPRGAGARLLRRRPRRHRRPAARRRARGGRAAGERPGARPARGGRRVGCVPRRSQRPAAAGRRAGDRRRRRGRQAVDAARPAPGAAAGLVDGVADAAARGLARGARSRARRRWPGDRPAAARRPAAGRDRRRPAGALRRRRRAAGRRARAARRASRARSSRPAGVAGPDRGRRRRARRRDPVRRHRRDDRAGRGPHRGLQRPRRAVRQATERGHAARLAQLDVLIRRGGLVLGRAHAVDPRPAAGRRARPADRRALRAPGRECGAHRPVGARRAGRQQGPRALPPDARARGLRRDPAHPRPRPAR